LNSLYTDYIMKVNMERIPQCGTSTKRRRLKKLRSGFHQQ
jgi:hypothetical protein